MNWKGSERKRSWLRNNLGILLEIEASFGTLSQDSYLISRPTVESSTSQIKTEALTLELARLDLDSEVVCIYYKVFIFKYLIR